jgi:predicted flap endonuclease-1-like 5' DNA nuclease
MLLLVLSSNFAAGSMRMASEEQGIPTWVWPVLILMVGFLVWWWLRKPAEEVSGPILTGRPDNKSQASVLPVITKTSAAPLSPTTLPHKVSHVPTPQSATAEASTPPEPEEDQDQKLPIVPPMFVRPDDLTIVGGIGPKINQVLHAAGIQSLFQLSESEVANLRDILTAAGVRLSDPTTWPQQARLAVAGDLETLKALQGTLKGGHRG